MYPSKLALSCALGCLALSPSVWASDEVSLLSVMNVPMSKYGMTWQTPQVRLRVKNLAYEKSLRLTFKADGGETVTQDASFVGPADAGYEIWEVWANLHTGLPYHFQIEYGAAGQSYRSDLYELKNGPVFYAGQNVQQVLSNRQFYGSYANFVTAVRNLAWHKKVEAHYSCDDFLSEQTLPLSFQPFYSYGYGYVTSPTPEGFEMWSGSVSNIPESCPVIRYYYTYEVNGEHFADTNFGQNYQTSRN